MSVFLVRFREYGADVEGVMDRFLDDEDLLKTCLDQFVSGNEFERLKEAVEGKQYGEAFEIAHALKGVSGNLGLVPLFKCICDLVESLRANSYDDLDIQLADVLDNMEKFEKAYEEMKA